MATRMEHMARWAVFPLLATGYFVAAKLGLRLAFVHASSTPVWPPTGIALAFLLLIGLRIWPAIFLGAFFANITTVGTIATSLGIATGNTLEGVVGAYLVQRFTGTRLPFECSRDVFLFAFLAAVVATTISATIGVTSLSLGGFAAWTQYGSIWLTWWLGDAGGALIVAPLLLLWGSSPHVTLSWKQIAERVVVFAMLSLIGFVIFDGWLKGGSLSNYALRLSSIPILIWIAFRFGPRETATAVFVLSCIAIWETLHGLGPFVLSSPNESLLLLQSFMGMTSLTSMTIATDVAERKRAEAALKVMNETLEGRVLHRTADLERIALKLRGEVEEHQKAEKELRKMHDELELRVHQRTVDIRRLAAARLQGVREDERTRIAREIHDELGQTLTGLKMDLSSMEAKLLEEKKEIPRAVLLEKTRSMFELLDQTITTVRRVSAELRPGMIDVLGIGAALEWQLHQFEERSGIACKCDFSHTTRFTLHQDASIAVFRIFQEMLTNVARHAEASEVRVELKKGDGYIHLMVEDNGKGISEAELIAPTSLGLIGMRERAELIGGTITFEGRPGKGTIAILRVPYREEEEVNF